VVGRALFGIDLNADAREFGLAFTTAQRLITRRQREVPVPAWVPTPSNLRYRAAITRIDEFIADLILTRRQLATQPPDVLGLLLTARFDDGSSMSDRQVRDEIATLFIGGHETVANHLVWTFYLLAQHPDIEAQLVAEWQAVLGDDTITADHLARLPFTDRVQAESLRLYPPVWTLARRVVESDRLPSGLALRRGDELLLSQYASHRNGSVFPDPERFDPDRWSSEAGRAAPNAAYFPFGTGPRYCIGEPFARLEAAVVLATIGRRFQLRPASERRVDKEALIAMRPRHGLPMRLHAR
jgi:cytochrome P450